MCGGGGGDGGGDGVRDHLITIVVIPVKTTRQQL